jgi:hypothetical protein
MSSLRCAHQCTEIEMLIPFVQIFGHLNPSDLLTLSRTNKALRSIIMSRKSSSVWKAARRTASIPDCPGDLSEPCWANLFCSEHCEVSTTRYYPCLHPSTCYSSHCFNIQDCDLIKVPMHKIKFTLRRRLCLECAQSRLGHCYYLCHLLFIFC